MDYKIVTIGDNIFSVSKDAKFLSIAQSTPQNVGDIVIYDIYNIKQSPPILVSKNEVITDAEQLAFIQELRKHIPYPYIGEE